MEVHTRYWLALRAGHDPRRQILNPPLHHGLFHGLTAQPACNACTARTLMMRWQQVSDRPTNVLYQLHNRSRTGVQSICIHYSSQAIIAALRFITDSFARGASVTAALRSRTLKIGARRIRQILIHQSPQRALLLITPFLHRSAPL